LLSDVVLCRPFVGQGSGKGTKEKGGKGTKGAGKAARSGGAVAWKQDGPAAAAAGGDGDAAADAAADDAVFNGMKQEEQERVLQEFRAGTVQVLVATCIGEEGLDVPQVRWCILFS
jgi:ERCC4-related helicase